MPIQATPYYTSRYLYCGRMTALAGLLLTLTTAWAVEPTAPTIKAKARHKSVNKTKQPSVAPVFAPNPLTAAAEPVAAPVTAEGPWLDIEAIRTQVRRGENMAPAGNAVSLAQANLSVQTPMAQAMSNAVRADCRTAYSGAGLLAIFPLIYDAVRSSGCKW